MEDQATAREAKDITPRTVAPPNPARDSRLSIVTRAPLPTLEQKVTPAADTSVKEPAVVEVSHDQEPDHDPATGEVAMEAEPDAFSSDEQTQDSAEAAPDDGTPEVLRSLRINVAAKNPFTREALREAIRSINLIKDEPLKLEAKRLYNEASKLVAA